jgi:protein gp37
MITPKQSPKIVFVDGHFDWNGVDVKKEWLEAILAKVSECSQHTFPILSKRPEFFGQYGLSYPKNVILGTTVTNEGPDTLPEMTEPYKAKADVTLKDWERLELLRNSAKGNRKAVSFEPLLGPLPEDVSLKRMDWVIVGSLSAGRKLIQPKKEWVKDIVDRSKEVGASIFMKNTLTDFKRLIQKYPANPR